jgi:signal transduction histidine kinase
MDTNLVDLNRKSAKTDYLRRLWQQIVKVTQSEPEQERLAYLIAAISSVVTIGSVAGALVLTLASPSSTGYISFIAIIAIFLTIYLLNRQGNYRAAALGLIGVFALAPLAALVRADKDLAFQGFTAMIAAISVLLTGVLFPRRNWGLVTAVAVVLLYLILPILHPVYSYTDVIYPLVGLAAVNLAIVLYDNQGVASEKERQATLETANAALQASEAALRQANARLEKDIKDSAIEMQAIVDEYERTRVELEEAWADAERANRVKSAFLASMSHELRTPLNAIINFSKFVVRGVVGPINDQQTEMLTNVVNSGQHLLNLINDVLDMSKIESGSLNLFVENDVDLNTICLDALNTAQSLIGDKPVEIRSDVAPDLPRLLGDRQRILQVLLNLLSNACKFTQQGHILLSVKHQADEVLISVRDTGPGIPKADWELIFEPFKQTETGIRQGQGTGLGMPISRNLAELHGGRIWLDSVPGEGTTFYVALPIKSSKLSVTSGQ